MIFDDFSTDEIDALIEKGLSPKPWMESMERVVDAYKAEVEMLRQRLKAVEHIVAELRKEGLQ